jgi:thiamine-monophosphate kinase
MLISEAGGEQGIIKFIEANFGGGGDPRVVVGLGDDAALLRMGGERLMIVTTDLLAEGTHFRCDIIDPYSLGWKSVAANISDIASMGGVPTWAFISIAVPDIEVSFIEWLYKGMNAISREFGSRIIGGDTNRIDGQIVLNVTQLGEVEEGRAALRSGARPGDRILVTGWLGESLAGLNVLLKHGMESALKGFPKVVERHIRPVPRVPEARVAVELGLVHGMMDISDGLATDLGKMCAASGVGAMVNAASLPVSRALTDAAVDLGDDPVLMAAGGGEDYELLIAAAPEYAETLIRAVEDATGTKVTDVGEFVEGEGTALMRADGTTGPLEPGWKHF